jgi:hypothetical protein
MPLLSNENRNFVIDGKQYYVKKTILFNDNCEIEYNQNQADLLYTRLKRTIQILDKYCPDDYWILGGTLLGRERFGILLPWDDDFDIGITMKAYDSLAHNMKSIQKIFDCELIETSIGYKVCYDDVCFGDLFVCDYINKEKMVYSGPVFEGVSTFHTYKYLFNQICFSYNDIFPLVRKPLGDIFANCPRKSKKILHNNYKKGVIQTIIPPIINDTHIYLPKSLWSSLYTVAAIYHKNNPELFKFFYVVVGKLMSFNMSNFINPKSYTITDIDFLELFSEQMQTQDLPVALLTFLVNLNKIE